MFRIIFNFPIAVIVSIGFAFEIYLYYYFIFEVVSAKSASKFHCDWVSPATFSMIFSCVLYRCGSNESISWAECFIFINL
ncbi:hypothetical protein HMPREF1978_00906, partial [Actinomyces graevenitzii F0530]